MTDEGAGLLGRKDQPIKDRGEEALGLGEYAEVLTEFIRRCDTPLTVALQGDWGSGKTSLMTLIKNDLSADDRYLTVWFNTWQYAQFNMETTLALSMMSKITDELAPDGGGRSQGAEAKPRGRDARRRHRGRKPSGAGPHGKGDGQRTLACGGGPEGDDPATALERIKEGLAKVVESRTSGATRKVVVFIDDLDRLVPQRAVELLEAMKVFLDIDGCVYVIACDYSVVAAGLEAKFGIGEAQLKGKSFFDRIIQVPFKMSTRRYQCTCSATIRMRT